MTRVNIDNVRSLPDFATTFRWNFIMAQAPLIGAAGFPLSADLDLRCESAELPKATNQKIEINIRGHKVFQPGITNFTNTISLTFAETVDNRISIFLKAWRELIWSFKSGSSFSKSDVEATIILQRLNSQDEPIFNYTLYGCFLEDEEAGGTLDGASSDILRPVAVLSYDYAQDTPLAI